MLSGNSLPKSCSYFGIVIQWDSLYAKQGSDMSLKCCLTTFWVSPVSKIGLGVECLSLLAALCGWKTQIWTKAADQSQMTVHMFTCPRRMNQHSRPPLTCEPLTCGCQGRAKFWLSFWGMSSWLLISWILKRRFSFFPLLGASIFNHEADSSVSASICKNWLSFYQDLFMLHCLGSLGTFTFLWLTADNNDCVSKFS